MDGTFTLRIKMGNAAMDTLDSVAAALRDTAEKLNGSVEGGGLIFDENGNCVGDFKVEE